MYSDNDNPIDELHYFARKIGLSKEWFIHWDLEPHYELTPQKRIIALIAGAKTYTERDAVGPSYFLTETVLRGKRFEKHKPA